MNARIDGRTRLRPGTTLTVLALLLLAVPGALWLQGLGEARVEVESPAAGPQGLPRAGEGSAEPDEPASVPTGPQEDPTATAEPEAPDAPGAPDAHGESAGPQPAGPFGTAAVTAGDFPFGGGEYALLTDVRVAGHDGFDRVVLELDGPDLPSYRVAYVDPPLIQDGSGEEISVDGTAFLELRLTPASGVDAVGEDWQPTYHGPYRVTGDTAVATEVVRLDDFEANLAWVVGLPTQQPFAVMVLSDPLRLVVDIRSG